MRKKIKPVATVVQDPLDKSVVEAIEFLCTTKTEHGMFEYKKDLLEKLKLRQNNYSAVFNGERHLPKGLHQHIIRVLTKEFGVSVMFLTTNQGEMFSRRLPVLEESQASYLTKMEEINHLRSANEKLKKKNHDLEMEVEQLKELNKTKDQTIKALNKLLK